MLEDFRFLLQSSAFNDIKDLDTEKEQINTKLFEYLNDSTCEIEVLETFLKELGLSSCEALPETVLWNLRHRLASKIPSNRFDYFEGEYLEGRFRIISRPISGSDLIKIRVNDDFNGFPRTILKFILRNNITYCILLDEKTGKEINASPVKIRSQIQKDRFSTAVETDFGDTIKWVLLVIVAMFIYFCFSKREADVNGK